MAAGMAGVVVIGLGLLVAGGTVTYVPSARLASTAPDMDREAQRRIVAYCRNGRVQEARLIPPNGTESSATLLSWSNDAGYLARTRIECPAHGPCTIHGSALIPAPSPGGRCV